MGIISVGEMGVDEMWIPRVTYVDNDVAAPVLGRQYT